MRVAGRKPRIARRERVVPLDLAEPARLAIGSGSARKVSPRHLEIVLGRQNRA